MNSAHAMKFEMGGSMPTFVGNTSQNFNTSFGLMASAYFDPLITPEINNFIIAEFSSFGLKVDSTTTFRVFPLMAGLELPGKVTEAVRTTFSAAGGVAFGYVNAVNANSYRAYTYPAAQGAGGVEADLGTGFSVFMKVPVTFLFGAKTVSYVDYMAGLGFKL